MKEKLKHWFGLCDFATCEPVETNKGDAAFFGDLAYEWRVQASPWASWIENKFECQVCHRSFWMRMEDFVVAKNDEFIFSLTVATARELKANGQIEKAIEVLSL